MFIMGCPAGKINMAAVSAKRSKIKTRYFSRDSAPLKNVITNGFYFLATKSH